MLIVGERNCWSIDKRISWLKCIMLASRTAQTMDSQNRRGSTALALVDCNLSTCGRPPRGNTPRAVGFGLVVVSCRAAERLRCFSAFAP